MKETRTFDSSELVASEAARDAVETLQRAIKQYGNAVWVLAGGSSPSLAYRSIIAYHADEVEWSKVTVLMGDERLVPFDSTDSNWGTTLPLFMDNMQTAQVRQLVPQTSLSVEDAAVNYDAQVGKLSRFDLVWLGVGEDGHTLSLFPGHPDFVETDQLVIAVHDSPKPPSLRITLTLRALKRAKKAVIFATGAAKQTALARVRGGEQLPIAQAASTVEKAGGDVVWLYDHEALDA